MVIDLHVQIPERGASFHRFELKFSGWGGHPFAAGFPVAQELKKIPRLRKATTEVVREYFAFCHLLVPPFKLLFLKPAKAAFGQKKSALI